MNASQFEIKIRAPVPDLTFLCKMDHFGEWLAQVKGMPGCTGDGLTKIEAIGNALCLYLHAKIMQIHRGRWTPTLIKQTD